MKNNKRVVQETQGITFLDYLNIVRNNIFPIVLITITCLIFAVIYALQSVNIYKSTTALKISKPTGNILESPLIPEFQDFGSDRFIANEIEILKSYQIREKVGLALLDSFVIRNKREDFSIIYDKNIKLSDGSFQLLDRDGIAEELKSVDIEQKKGLDLVEISVQSPSPYEAALIANVYAQVYRQINLEFNRNQVTLIKSFLSQQRSEKLQELNQAEEILKNFQEKGGIILLDQQATSLINQLSSFESQRNLAKIQLTASDQVLSQLKNELKSKDPKFSQYVESVMNEEYLKSLQSQIAELEWNREAALSSKNANNPSNATVVAEYDKKIKNLKTILAQKLDVFKSSLLAASPTEYKTMTQRLVDEEVKNQALHIQIEQLNQIVQTYEKQFNQLPKSSIELAKLQRNRESLEKLFLLVEQKYQESLINEQSTPGNVVIIDKARINSSPAKPNRVIIILVGAVLGLGIALGYAFLKNYFDNTVKTPEDIERYNTNVLAWIPQIEGSGSTGRNEYEFIVHQKPDSIPSEAFRALRTRVQFSRVDDNALKTILVTSSAPSEGKTMICTNLAGSFAHSNKRTLLLDCDLRKPRVHTIFGMQRYPGLVDHLFGQATIEEITRPTEMNNLFVITAGTIPPNPSELLESERMREFLEEIQGLYDYILIDSPPIIAVTDSEILSRKADATILVVSANTTEIDLMSKAIDIIKHDNVNFIGTVLNNFIYRASYGSYYKYYYYYTRPRKADKSKLPPISTN